MKRVFLRALLLLVVTVPFTAPRPARAIWLDTLTTYYAGPCEDLAYNGYSWRECDGTRTSSGTLSGSWREDDVYDCDTGQFSYYWYERCNNTWVYRYGGSTSRFPTAADCQCS